MNMEPPIVVVTEPGREELLTVHEFASYVRIHPWSVYRMIRAQRLSGVVRVGNQIRINLSVAVTSGCLARDGH